jgi:hypothetical protein
VDNDEIMLLCAQLLVARDRESVQAISAQLQTAIHDHIERLRAQARDNAPSSKPVRVLRLRRKLEKTGT